LDKTKPPKGSLGEVFFADNKEPITMNIFSPSPAKPRPFLKKLFIGKDWIEWSERQQDKPEISLD